VLAATWAATGGLPLFLRPPEPAAWDGPFALPLARLAGTTAATLVLGALALAASVRAAFEYDPIAGTGRLFATLLLLAPAFQPWSVLAVLPFAALARHPAWLALSGLALLLYLPRCLGVPLLPWPFVAVLLPTAALLLLPAVRRARGGPGAAPEPSWSIA